MKSVLEIYDIHKKERKTLAVFDELIEAPNWSHDGKFLTYNSRGKIYRFDLECYKSTEIYTDYVNQCNNDHVLSPDGTRIAVSHNVKEDGLSRIFIVPLQGGIPQLITPLGPSYLHGWSHDGKTLAYCAQRQDSYDIYTIPAEGGNETRLTIAGGLNDGPEYDSRGEYIWFNSVRTGMMQAWRMKPDGTKQVQMTFEKDWNIWFPHISPDGKKVVMLAYHKNDVKPYEHVPDKNVELRLMNSDGSDMQTIVRLFGGQGTINVNSWSPDSGRFAFVSYK